MARDSMKELSVAKKVGIESIANITGPSTRVANGTSGEGAVSEGQLAALGLPIRSVSAEPSGKVLVKLKHRQNAVKTSAVCFSIDVTTSRQL